MAKKEKKTRKKGKKIRKGRKHESVKIWKKYEVKGESISRKNNFCPRCGGGIWLSKQKNRLYCGKCGYTSFGPGKPAKEIKPPEEKPEETLKEEKIEQTKEETKPEEKPPESSEEEKPKENQEKKAE